MKKNENLYSDRSNRLRDIFKGILIGIIFIVLYFIILFNMRISSTIIIILLGTFLAISGSFVFIKRFYISVGMLIMIAIPLLLLGSCLFMLG